MSQIVEISKGGLVARIDSMGAQLKGLALDGREYLWQADPAWWAKSSPVLFPVVGAPGYEALDSCAGPCVLPKHGFARDLEHGVARIATDGSAVTFELCDTPETREMFPYRFMLNMEYAVTGPATLTQTFRVANTGDAPMPFSVGGHPAFNVPVCGEDGEGFEDYELRFKEAWTADSPKVVAGGLMSLADPFRVIDDANAMPLVRGLFEFDTVVLTDVPGGTIDLVGKKSGRGVRLDFDGFKFVGIWSAQPDAPFVAIEPWTGHAAFDCEDDVFEHRDNVTVLAPGETGSWSFSMTLH